MNPRLNRRAVAAALLAAPALLRAQTGHSDNPVRLVVGYAAGGPVDGAARAFAPLLQRELGRPVVVDNRPGAAGVLAAELVAKSAPDGQVLYFGASPTLTISPHVLKGMTLDPQRDLLPLAPLVSYANLLVVNKDLGLTTLQQLLALARSKPGGVFYGSAGIGASNHLSGELLARLADVKLTHVPYKGNAPAMNDVIGGQLQCMFDIVSTARGFVQGGRVRALAVTSRERNASLPDVPTMREAGLPGYEVIGWYALYGPPKLPAELAAKVNGATGRALADAALRKLWLDQGYDLWSGGPELVAEQQKRDFELWRGVTRGMTFE